MINKASDIKETATSSLANLTLRKDGIITHELFEGKFKTNLEALAQELDIFLEWSKDEKKTFLVDMRRFKESKIEERLFIQTNLNRFSSKYALIIEKGISFYLYNILNYLTKPTVPTKFFFKVEDAINWLKKP
jgi:hypothetical protein